MDIYKEYARVRKLYQAKLKRVRVKQPYYDMAEVMGNAPTTKYVRQWSTESVQNEIDNMQRFLKRGGEKLVEYHDGVYPQAYVQNYEAALERVKKQKLYRVEEPNRGSGDKLRNFFASFMASTLYKGSGSGIKAAEERYQQNYIKALINAYGHTPEVDRLIALIKKQSPDDLLNAFYIKGNEDLSISNIYPGENMGDDDVAEYVNYLYDRWVEELNFN